MILTIHQPCFFPYLGIFKKIDEADMFLLYDDTQYKKGYVFERNKVKTAHGSKWFKIPLDYKFGDHLDDVRIKYDIKWQEGLIKLLESSYSDSPYFKDYMPGITGVISRRYANLASAGAASMFHILNLFCINRKVGATSNMTVGGKSTERLVGLCEAVEADYYISGVSGKNYLNMELFKAAGIDVRFCEFTAREYPQQHGDFIPNLSVLDYLFNCGPDPSIWR